MLVNHKINCLFKSCECQGKEKLEQIDNYKIVCSLYENVLMRFSKENQSGIFQRYIEFKIKHGEIGKALLLNYTNKFSTWNLFRKIDRVRNGIRIR